MRKAPANITRQRPQRRSSTPADAALRALAEDDDKLVAAWAARLLRHGERAESQDDRRQKQEA